MNREYMFPDVKVVKKWLMINHLEEIYLYVQVEKSKSSIEEEEEEEENY